MATAAWAPSGPPFFGVGIDYECATDMSELRKNLQDAAGESENGHVIVHFTAALSNDVKWCPGQSTISSALLQTCLDSYII